MRWLHILAVRSPLGNIYRYVFWLYTILWKSANFYFFITNSACTTLLSLARYWFNYIDEEAKHIRSDLITSTQYICVFFSCCHCVISATWLFILIKAFTVLIWISSKTPSKRIRAVIRNHKQFNIYHIPAICWCFSQAIQAVIKLGSLTQNQYLIELIG